MRSRSAAESMLRSRSMTSAAPVRFKAIELTSSILGRRVRLELEPTCTVLVGRNASGKTLVVESVMMGLYNSSHRPPDSVAGWMAPTEFACEIEHGETQYLYRYSFVSKESPEFGSETTTERLDWREECRRTDGDQAVLWRVESGMVTSSLDETKMILPEGSGLLHTSLKGMPLSVVSHAEVVRSALEGIRIVFTELPRTISEKTEVFLRRQSGKKQSAAPGSSEKLAPLVMMASSIMKLFEFRPEDFRHLQDVCLRVLGEKLDAVVYRDERGSGEDVGEVTLGGTNLGLVSDGTLRVLDMLSAMTTSSRSSLLVIEEPEMCVHPGLLGRVLSEIESRASDGQVLLSTHSPQVLDWRSSDPGALRFVTREHGVTNVKRIGPNSLSRITAYMLDEGSLSDIVFQSDEIGGD